MGFPCERARHKIKKSLDRPKQQKNCEYSYCIEPSNDECTISKSSIISSPQTQSHLHSLSFTLEEKIPEPINYLSSSAAASPTATATTKKIPIATHCTAKKTSSPIAPKIKSHLLSDSVVNSFITPTKCELHRIGNVVLSRITQLTTFDKLCNNKNINKTAHLSISNSINNTNSSSRSNSSCNRNYSSVNTKKLRKNHNCNNSSIINSSSNSCNCKISITNSHYLLRQSLCLYAACIIILTLCYLSTSIAATDAPHPIFAEGKSDKEILDHLLKNARYDKRLLPPVDDADFCCGMDTPDKAKNISGWAPGRAQNRGTLTVNVSVLLLSLASPDESSLKYEVEFLLQQQWHDPRLRYANQSQYEYLNAIHHHENIWLPDTYFIMHGDFKEPIVPMHFALRIYRNGTINYLMRRHLILSCQGRLNIFPFDDPLCSFAMESISYEQSAITYVWKNDEDTLRKSPSLTTLNAYLIQNATTACPIKASWRADAQTMSEEDEEFMCSLCQRRFEGNYSCLKVDLIFTRDRAFYFTTVFIPGIILVTSSFITFWLEWNAVPARSMIGNYSCLKVDLMFTRDRAFYFTTVFIPGIILVTSSFITFWLEWNAVPARVMIGVTTMLNFFTTSNGFRSTLPVVSNLTAMNVWDGVCMCFIYASLLEFVCVNYVGRKRPLHNVVYRPGENPVTQRLPAVLSRIGIILASPLDVIESEFLAATTSENKSPNATLVRRHNHQEDLHQLHRPFHSNMQQQDNQHYHHLPYQQVTVPLPRNIHTNGNSCNIYDDLELGKLSTIELPQKPPRKKSNRIDESLLDDNNVNQSDGKPSSLRRRSTTAIVTIEQPQQPLKSLQYSSNDENNVASTSSNVSTELTSSSPIAEPSVLMLRTPSAIELSTERNIIENITNDEAKLKTILENDDGNKKRDASGPNEIVACTNCGGGNSPCTHSANNGCATETCFVQVRKKEPPHPIRVAKTIDVIARITFPTAYSIFLIFFFIHYKGFS